MMPFSDSQYLSLRMPKSTACGFPAAASPRLQQGQRGAVSDNDKASNKLQPSGLRSASHRHGLDTFFAYWKKTSA